MVLYKDFESNCKRIAKCIMKDASDPYGTSVGSGVITVEASKQLLEEIFDQKYRKKYIREINKRLKECTVTYRYISFPENTITFDIEFDEVDAEFEDW